MRLGSSATNQPHEWVRVCRGCNGRCRTSGVGAITLDTYSHAIPAMQEEEAALIAGLVFAGK